jgi:putative phosphoribosyl transferase
MSGSVHIFQRKDLRGRVQVFRDRAHAGEVLAELLAPAYARRHATVLAIPAGGVPVAAVVARRLGLSLDLVTVSKITLPWNSESGYGAVAFDGSVYLDEPLVRAAGLGAADVEAGIARARAKVARRDSELREDRGYSALTGAEVVVVDDGLASGSTLRAAVSALRATGVATIAVAVPTAYRPSARDIAASVEGLYCANVRRGHRYAVADAYRRWSDVDEGTVRAILATFGHQGAGEASGDGEDAGGGDGDSSGVGETSGDGDAVGGGGTMP